MNLKSVSKRSGPVVDERADSLELRRDSKPILWHMSERDAFPPMICWALSGGIGPWLPLSNTTVLTTGRMGLSSEAVGDCRKMSNLVLGSPLTLPRAKMFRWGSFIRQGVEEILVWKGNPHSSAFSDRSILNYSLKCTLADLWNSKNIFQGLEG